jgi:hypothetical protein
VSGVLYKFLRCGAIGTCSGFGWPVPRDGGPGDWVGDEGPPLPCRKGVHACRADQLPSWISDELWRIELGGELHEEEAFVVASRGRLVSRVREWEEGMAQEFAAACASGARVRADASGSALAAAYASDSGAYASAARGGLTAEIPKYVAEDLAAIPAGEALGFAVAIAALASARCAGEAAAGRGGERAYATAFEKERRRQGLWLAQRLG